MKQGASGAVAVLVFDGFADWEPAFALTGLRQWARVPVTTVGYDTQPILSMGGLRVLPDITGLGAVEFAKEIFAELGVFGDTDLRLFEEMYRHGRSPPEPTA